MFVQKTQDVSAETQSKFVKFEGPHTHLGTHIVAEFFQCDFDALNNAKMIE